MLLEAYNANLADLEAHRGALAAGADALIAQELITGELLNLRACVCHALAPVLAICAGALAPRRGLKGGGSTGRCVLASTCLQSKALCAGSPFLPASHACHAPKSSPTPPAGKELEAILAAHPPVEPESVRQVTAEPLDNLLPA